VRIAGAGGAHSLDCTVGVPCKSAYGAVLVHGSPRGSRSLTLLASPSSLSLLLARLEYVGDRDWAGEDAVRVDVHGALPLTLPVTVRPVNDPPLLSGPGESVPFPVTAGQAVLLTGRSSPLPPLDAPASPFASFPRDTGYELFASRGGDPPPRTDELGLEAGGGGEGAGVGSEEGEDWRMSLVVDAVEGAGQGGEPRELTTFAGRLFFTLHTPTTGRELFALSPPAMGRGGGGATWALDCVADLLPGVRGGEPRGLSLVSGRLLFTSLGVDGAWADGTDGCGGWQEVMPGRLALALALGHEWARGAAYDCPAGWEWATTAQGRVAFPGPPPEGGADTGSPALRPARPAYADVCGWTGLPSSSRRWFRFSDSASTGAAKDGLAPLHAPLLTRWATTGFAGVVCVPAAEGWEDVGRGLWALEPAVPADRSGVGIGTLAVRRLSGPRNLPADSPPAYLPPGPDSVDGSPRALFPVPAPHVGTELWTAGVTAPLTPTLVMDILPGPPSSLPAHLTARPGPLGAHRYASSPASDTAAGAGDVSAGLAVLFTSDNGLQGRELWSSGGGQGQTALLLDIAPGMASSSPADLYAAPADCALAGLVFFSADDGQSGCEPWVTDGSVGGTARLADVRAGAGSSSPSGFTEFGGRVYFSADDGVHGAELWATDGSVGGTMLVADCVPGFAPSSPTGLTVFTPRPGTPPALYFFARSAHPFGGAMDGDGSGGPGWQLWHCDGATAVAAHGLDYPGAAVDLPATLPYRPVALAGALFFTARRGRDYAVVSREWSPSAKGVARSSFTVADADGPGPYSLRVESVGGKGTPLLTALPPSLSPSAVLSPSPDGRGVTCSPCSLGALNALLAEVRYVALPGAEGMDQVRVSVTDLTGDGALSISTVRIDIERLAHVGPLAPPSLAVRVRNPAGSLSSLLPGPSTPLLMPAHLAVVLSHPDGEGRTAVDGNGVPSRPALAVSLAVSAGTLSVASLAGLTWLSGSGRGDVEATFLGDGVAVGEALDSVQWECEGLQVDGCAVGSELILTVTVADGDSVDRPQAVTVAVTAA
jgi:ELWxxDGT repeat protein